MQKLIALILIGSVLGTAAPAFAAGSSTDPLCGADGPESYKRAGGYCEQIGANESLVREGEDKYFFYYDIV